MRGCALWMPQVITFGIPCRVSVVPLLITNYIPSFCTDSLLFFLFFSSRIPLVHNIQNICLLATLTVLCHIYVALSSASFLPLKIVALILSVSTLQCELVIGNCLGRRVVSRGSKKGEIQWEGYAGPMYVAIQSLASRKEGQLQYIRNPRILPATFGYTID